MAELNDPLLNQVEKVFISGKHFPSMKEVNKRLAELDAEIEKLGEVEDD